MTPFLKEVAQNIISKHGDQLEACCIILPSKRAGLYLRKYLSEVISESSDQDACFLPDIYTINDFIGKYSQRAVPHDFELILTLYECFLKLTSDTATTLDRFYPLGEMLLKDFEEIDQYNINIEDIFFNLDALQKMKRSELEYLIKDYKAIEDFVKHYQQSSDGDVKAQFRLLWDMVAKLYHLFHKQLKENNLGYPGLLSREFALGVKDTSIDLNYNHIIFTGFNALTATEEILFEALLKNGKGEVYWKYDDAFLKSNSNEAGLFIRRFIKQWGHYENSIPITSTLENHQKDIKIFSTPQLINQTKITSNLLQEFEGTDIENTAIVLADEQLLEPLLKAIPEHITPLNITMGVPMHTTMLYSLVEKVISVMLNKRIKDGMVTHYHLHLSPLLHHPYFKIIGGEQLKILNALITKNNLIYVNNADITEITDANENLVALFNILHSDVNEKNTVPACASSILRLCFDILNEKHLNAAEREYFQRADQLLNRFDTLINKPELKDLISNDLISKLITQVFRSSKFPLEGEPLQGLQIMGALETRVLDFEHIILLSMNEGTFPATSLRSSMLPYSVRVGFGLPTYKTREVIYAHHFYSLIQKSKNLTLVYNSESNTEKSRYITQLLFEQKLYNGNVDITSSSFSYDILSKKQRDNHVEKNIEISKTPEIISFLKDKYAPHQEKALSPSALITYMNCSLKFYFNYVAKIKEVSETEEELRAVDIGNIIHKSLELSYNGFEEVSKTDIDKMITDIPSVLEEAIKIENIKIKEEGFNKFLYSAIKTYVKLILDEDKKETPFKIIGLEKEVDALINANDDAIKFIGNIDHIRQKDGTTTIIDYKTGSVLKGKPELSQIYHGIENKPDDYKHLFQLLSYGFLYLSQNPKEKIELQLFYPKENKTVEIKGLKQLEDFKVFSELLEKIILEILSPEIKFTPTLDEKKCVYCPYIMLCNRN